MVGLIGLFVLNDYVDIQSAAALDQSGRYPALAGHFNRWYDYMASIICSIGDQQMKNYVKVYRAMHNLTQAQLAEKLEVSRAAINAIEKERYDPSLKLAFKMARLFEVKIEELFENEET